MTSARTLTTYDLVTYGKNTAGSNQCYGSYNSTSGAGYGPAYENSCIHSGTIKSLGDLPTAWYNYALASAGTIIDKNTTSSSPTTNTDTATESICPKGWTLSSRIQANNVIGSIIDFQPIAGGSYASGGLVDEAVYGYWWTNNGGDAASRYRLGYNHSSGGFYVNSNGRRYQGLYIRCVQAS